MDALKFWNIDYPIEIARYHYKLAYLDYARFIISRFWSKDMNEETFNKKKDNPNVTLPNRDLKAAIYMAFNVHKNLKWLEDRGFDIE